MDAQAVAAAAGVAVGTLNVWIQRGLIPGMTIGSRGRQRNFDLTTAVGIGIIGELVELGGCSVGSKERAERASC